MVATFRAGAKLQRRDPDYHFILGDALAQLGRHAEAVAVLREAIEMSREEAAYHQALAKSLWTLGELEAAVAAFREAARLRPRDVSVLNALGVALTGAGEYREAVATLHSALRLEPYQARVYGNLGVALFRSGRIGQASRAFRKAVQLGRSGDGEPHRNLGLALEASGQVEQALSSFREAIRLNPDDPQAHLDLGDLLHTQGRPEEALAAYDAAVRLDPGCLRDRPETREKREAIRLERLREEVRSESESRHPAVTLWRAILAGGHTLEAVVPRGWGGAWTLLIILVLGRVGWVTVVPYWNYWMFRDKVAEIAGAPVREDKDVMELILAAAHEHGLESQVKSNSCSIETHGRWRIVRCQYDRPLRFLPGVAPVARFQFTVERPFFAGETAFF